MTFIAISTPIFRVSAAISRSVEKETLSECAVLKIEKICTDVTLRILLIMEEYFIYNMIIK